MNDEKPLELQPSEPPEDNATPPPVPPPAEKAQWQMPKPVFKKTSGYLPQGFEKLAAFDPVSNQPIAAAAAPQTAEPSDTPPAETLAPVGEQPDILEDISDEVVETASIATKRPSSTLRIAVGVFVVLLVLAVVVGFLTFIYIWFLSGEVPAIG
jgi:hypothetical protein